MINSSVVECPECGEIYFSSRSVCTACGHNFEPVPKKGWFCNDCGSAQVAVLSKNTAILSYKYVCRNCGHYMNQIEAMKGVM